MFYIQDTRGYAYDYMLWWGPNRSGYTYNLDQAGKYTETEAREQEASRETDKAWPCDVVDATSNRATSIARMRIAMSNEMVPHPPPEESHACACERECCPHMPLKCEFQVDGPDEECGRCSE